MEHAPFARYGALNAGVPGDMIGHIIWRINDTPFPLGCMLGLLGGTNNITVSTPKQVADTIVSVALSVPNEVQIIVFALLPRGDPQS